MTTPGDPTPSVDVRVIRETVRLELRALLRAAFPTDDADYHYGLEALLDAVRRRLAELDDLDPPTEGE